MKIRPFQPADAAALGALVDADRLPGQPACSPAMVAAVLSGRSTVDAWSWEQLASMRVLAAEGPDGDLAGAGAIGRRATGERYLLWLHAREGRRTLDLLLAGLLRGLRRSDPVFGFAFPSDLSIGLEGLPRQARPVTHDALVAKGFVGEERWLYLRAAGPGPAPAAGYRRRGHGPDVRIELVAGGTVVGSAELGLPAPGLGVVWWLEVDPAHQRQGHGRQLVRAARHELRDAGAGETILFVDRDRGEPGWRPALGLYLSEGYEIVDRLWCYRRGEVPEAVRQKRSPL